MKKTNKSNRRKKKKKIILKSKDDNDNSIKYYVLTDLSNYKVNNIIAVKNFSNKLYVFANCVDLEKDEVYNQFFKKLLEINTPLNPSIKNYVYAS